MEAGKGRACDWAWEENGPSMLQSGSGRVSNSLPVPSVWPSADAGADHANDSSIYREVREGPRLALFPDSPDISGGSAGLTADPATSSESSMFFQVPRTAAGPENLEGSPSSRAFLMVGEPGAGSCHSLRVLPLLPIS